MCFCTKALLRDQGGQNPDCTLLTRPGVGVEPCTCLDEGPFFSYRHPLLAEGHLCLTGTEASPHPVTRLDPEALD